MYKIESIEDAKALEDCELGVSEWITINQKRINQFANATGDDQWIHVDSSRAKNELPDGKTIAHGYLTLSLIPALTRNFIEVAGLSQVINFGCNKVRFYSTVNEGDKVEAGQTIATWDPHTRPIVTEQAGKAKLIDFEDGLKKIIAHDTSMETQWANNSKPVYTYTD